MLVLCAIFCLLSGERGRAKGTNFDILGSVLVTGGMLLLVFTLFAPPGALACRLTKSFSGQSAVAAEASLPGSNPAEAPSCVCYSINAMGWGTVELEPEVRDWLERLPNTRFATAAFYIDLLADEGPLLSEPYTRQLDGKLRELRFHLVRQSVRITYWIAPGRRIVLLTVFAKTREAREIERAKRALAKCITDEHTVDDDAVKEDADE